MSFITKSLVLMTLCIIVVSFQLIWTRIMMEMTNLSWKLCVICGKKIRGKTSNLLPDQCRKTLGQLYLFCTKFKTILDKDLNLMPVNLKIDQLDSGFGMEERTLKTLFSHLSRLPLHEIMRDMGKNENLSASNPPAQDS